LSPPATTRPADVVFGGSRLRAEPPGGDGLGHTFGVTQVSPTVHRPLHELEAGLEHVRRSPTDDGSLEMIVVRPAEDAREVLDEGWLDPVVGLVGDTWGARGSTSTQDGSANPDAQVTVMNARLAALVAGTADHGGLAGDQLYVDLDLSAERLPAGSRLQIGEAVLEVTAKPHRGCSKFAARFGKDALRFVNTGEGLVLNLRGRNAKVVVPGAVRRGDTVKRITPGSGG
jgi:hypothetical protein